MNVRSHLAVRTDPLASDAGLGSYEGTANCLLAELVVDVRCSVEAVCTAAVRAQRVLTWLTDPPVQTFLAAAMTVHTGARVVQHFQAKPHTHAHLQLLCELTLAFNDLSGYEKHFCLGAEIAAHC